MFRKLKTEDGRIKLTVWVAKSTKQIDTLNQILFSLSATKCKKTIKLKIGVVCFYHTDMQHQKWQCLVNSLVISNTELLKKHLITSINLHFSCQSDCDIPLNIKIPLPVMPVNEYCFRRHSLSTPYTNSTNTVLWRNAKLTSFKRRRSHYQTFVGDTWLQEPHICRYSKQITSETS